MIDTVHAEQPSVFREKFSEEEQRLLLEEDRTAQLNISAILGALIAIGMFLGLFAVSLISKFGLR